MHRAAPGCTELGEDWGSAVGPGEPPNVRQHLNRLSSEPLGGVGVVVRHRPGLVARHRRYPRRVNTGLTEPCCGRDAEEWNSSGSGDQRGQLLQLATELGGSILVRERSHLAPDPQVIAESNVPARRCDTLTGLVSPVGWSFLPTAPSAQHPDRPGHSQPQNATSGRH